MSCLSKAVSVLSVIGMIGLTGPARAEDAPVSYENRPIEFLTVNDIRIEKEVLTLRENRVDAEYTLLNAEKKPASLKIAFPMPFSGHRGQLNTSNEVRVWSAGQQVTTTPDFVVLLDEQDVAPLLKSWGWSEKTLSDFIRSGVKPAGVQAIPDDWFDSAGQPLFSMHLFQVWQQNFSAGGSVQIRVRYTPYVESGMPVKATELISDYRHSVCIDSGVESSIRSRESEFGVGWAKLTYNLTAGNISGEKVKDFTLLIKKLQPTDLVSFCGYGPLTKTDPLTFEYHAEDFSPENDIRLLYVRALK